MQLRRIGLSLAAAIVLVAAAPAPARVTVLEFTDPGCAHCRYFTRHTFPRLSAEFIETGKVQWRRSNYRSALARDMRVRTRPTFFIDGVRVEGAIPYETFRAKLLAAVRSRSR